MGVNRNCKLEFQDVKSLSKIKKKQDKNNKKWDTNQIKYLKLMTN